jgi:hypothetical protein
MRINKQLFVTILGIIVAIVLGVAKIASDNERARSGIELRVTGTSTILSRPEKLDGLKITYNGEALDKLSQTVFSVVDTGNTPIQKKDVSSALFVLFDEAQNIIDAKVVETFPQGVDAELKYNKELGKVTLEIPLLNPGDRVDFSVLAKSAQIPFTAGARIAGVPPLVVTRVSAQDPPEKRHSWTVYPVAVLFMLCLLICIAGFFMLLAELRMRQRFSLETFTLPTHSTKEEWISWVNSTFSFALEKERSPLIDFFKNQPDGQNMASLDREQVMAEVQALLIRTVSNIKMFLFFLTVVILSGMYLVEKW